MIGVSVWSVKVWVVVCHSGGISKWEGNFVEKWGRDGGEERCVGRRKEVDL
jgi:hypothetical protein